MAENFQDNVVYGGSTLAVSGDAIAVGSTDAGAKSIIFNNSGSQGHLAWQPTAARTINLPDLGGTIQLTGQVPGAIYDGANSITTGTIRFTNANGVSFSINGQTISGSVAAQSVQTQSLIQAIYDGANSITTGTIRFTNANGVSFSINGQTISGSVAAQTVQTVGLYALGNTTQNSSTTLDARTLSFNGLGAATVGYTNGSIQISVPVQTAQTQSLIQAIYDGANSITTGTIRFTNANGVSFSINGQTISGSVAAQSVQTEGMYAIGNTVGQSSSSTFDARTMSVSGAGIASVGYSGNALVISVPSAAAQINFSAGTTSNNLGAVTFSNANGVSFGLNGSTITASIAPRKVFQLGPDSPWQTNFTISNASFSLQHFYPKADLSATQANLLMALSGHTNSTGALTISIGAYTMAGSTMSLASSTSRQITWTSGSQTTNSTVYGGISGTCYRTVAIGNWNFTAGDYMLGVWCRTTNDGSWSMFGTQGPTIVNANDVNETQAYLAGYFSTGSWTTAMVASINLTDTNYVRTGGPVLQQPSIIFMGTV